ncbi:hypothetical protein [Clostridium vitabionis]|uniref:hypothetical protein n=1 Tax=Clostridium vitabionis TaxID=2784388 RepID=UPI00188C22E1|nr:hypothetical protein [Clostridium vitabionis]
MITPKEYRERLLAKYMPTFDIEVPYSVGGTIYPAYACFSSKSEKYVLVRQANLWTTDSHEHVLFLERERCGAEITEEVKRLVEQHMEPEMVRGGEKLPEKDHMISYLTVIVLLRETPDPDTVQAVRRFRFTRSYLFTLRGRAETHLILADLGKEQIFTNRDAARHRKIYEDIFREVHQGLPGYLDLLAKQQ